MSFREAQRRGILNYSLRSRFLILFAMAGCGKLSAAKTKSAPKGAAAKMLYLITFLTAMLAGYAIAAPATISTSPFMPTNNSTKETGFAAPNAETKP